MLRIFVFPEPTIITFRAEGELTAESLPRLAGLVDNELWDPRHRKIAIDLGEVSIGDDMALGWVDGLVPRGIHVLALKANASQYLQARAARICSSTCNAFQRLLFRLGGHLGALPDRQRNRLCRAIHALLPQQLRARDAADDCWSSLRG